MFVGGCGCCRCVKALVEAGANVDMQTHSSKEKNKGAVALHYAAQEDHHEVVQYLIRKSAGVNIQDARGCTPLHYAAYKGPFFLCVLPHGENGGACAMSSVPLRLASAVNAQVGCPWRGL
jgi:ankyrin repeat protein